MCSLFRALRRERVRPLGRLAITLAALHAPSGPEIRTRTPRDSTSPEAPSKYGAACCGTPCTWSHSPINSLPTGPPTGTTGGPLRQDRIFNQAFESTDPLKLMRLFAMTEQTAVRYVGATNPERTAKLLK